MCPSIESESDGLTGKHVRIFAIDPQVTESPITGKVVKRMKNLDVAVFRTTSFQAAKAWLVKLDEPLELYSFLSEPKTTVITLVMLLFWDLEDVANLLESGRAASCDIHLYASDLKDAMDVIAIPPEGFYTLAKEVEVSIVPEKPLSSTSSNH